MGCVQFRKSSPVAKISLKPKDEEAWSRIDRSTTTATSRKRRKKTKSETDKSEVKKKKRKRKTTSQTEKTEWTEVKTDAVDESRSSLKPSQHEEKPVVHASKDEKPSPLQLNDNKEESPPEKPIPVLHKIEQQKEAEPPCVVHPDPPKPALSPLASAPAVLPAQSPPEQQDFANSNNGNNGDADTGDGRRLSSASGRKMSVSKMRPQKPISTRTIIRDHEPLSNAKLAKITNWIMSQPRHLFVDPATLV
eukprot:TRINITY_DN3309_c3_g1_i2.p2 TRINITY_DN3309_c3_g1~~TRINITY_DN3309_c3_g1_i2.p2  ORF type:complete len:249 (+),score=27.12 TRINITY_DN3309_c3_g1_i2:59-805(+)